jgi:5-methylcytosine-specific restriction endonuclease McrA
MDKEQELKAYYRAHNQKHRENQRALMKKWYIKNAESIKAKRKARFFFIRAGSVATRSGVKTAKQLTGILSRLWYTQRGKCALTGRKLTRENARVDHIHPTSRGGTSDESNLRWLVVECNQSKSDLTDSEFITMCREVVALADK